MTTIAYKDGVIAYESRELSGDTIVCDNVNKKRHVDGIFYFCSGAVADFPDLFEIYQGRRPEIESGGQALAVDKGRLFLVGMNKRDGGWVQPWPLNMPYAIGTGASFAFTAMDMGADAVEAVKMAIKRDCGSGGKVRKHVVKK